MAVPATKRAFHIDVGFRAVSLTGNLTIYTVNSIEAVHRQFRDLTNTKGGFPNDDNLLVLLFMGIQDASNKWTVSIQNWNLTNS